LAEVDSPSDWDYCQALAELIDRAETMHACIVDIYDQLGRLKHGHESNWSRIVKLEEGPAVAEARGQGSVGDIVATEEELAQLYSSGTWHREVLRAIYNLGRQHVAAAQPTLQNHQ